MSGTQPSNYSPAPDDGDDDGDGETICILEGKRPTFSIQTTTHTVQSNGRNCAKTDKNCIAQQKKGFKKSQKQNQQILALGNGRKSFNFQYKIPPQSDSNKLEYS